MKDTSAFFDAEMREGLGWVVESSLGVRNRSGFFLWTQGAVQTLVPHEILVCGVGNGGPRNMNMIWFSSSRYFREEQFRAACEPQAGLVSQLLTEWCSTGRPSLLAPDEADAEVGRVLESSELKSVAAHGLRGADGEACGWFCFGRTPVRQGAHAALVLDAVVPYLYATLCRVLAEELRNSAPAIRIENPVTLREAEILSWIKEGKTTADIAGILRLSPFTVKNHVQSILRKLGARSRSHAVAQAMSRGLLQDRG